MRKLQFDVAMCIALLVQDGGGKSPETVPGHAAFESHPFQRFQEGVVAHGLIRNEYTRKSTRTQ